MDELALIPTDPAPLITADCGTASVGRTCVHWLDTGKDRWIDRQRDDG